MIFRLTLLRGNALASIALVLLFAGAALSQEPSEIIRGPILGFLPDSRNESIRPMLGIAGAALLGHPISLDYPVRIASISPKQDYALAVAGDPGITSIIRFHPYSISVDALEQIHSGTDLLAISPTGAAAAAFDHETGVFQSLAITDVPKVVFKFDASLVRGRLTGMAIADDGLAAVLTFADEDRINVWMVTSRGDRWVVHQHPSAVAFLPNSHDVVISDNTASEIFLLAGSRAAKSSLTSFADSTSISALATSEDGKRVFALTDSGSVIILDVKSRISVTLECGCKATGLHRLLGPEVFRLSNPSDGPVAVLDATTAEPRVVVIPAGVEQ